MIAGKMETKTWVFLHRYGKVYQLCDEIDVIKPFIVSDDSQKYAVFIFDWKKRVGTNIYSLKINFEEMPLGNSYNSNKGL